MSVKYGAVSSVSLKNHLK